MSQIRTIMRQKVGAVVFPSAFGLSISPLASSPSPSASLRFSCVQGESRAVRFRLKGLKSSDIMEILLAALKHSGKHQQLSLPLRILWEAGVTFDLANEDGTTLLDYAYAVLDEENDDDWACVLYIVARTNTVCIV